MSKVIIFILCFIQLTSFLYAKEQLTESDITLLDFQIGKSKLNEIQEKLGSAKKIPRPEHQADKICYVSTDPDSSIIVFGSGSMGGWSTLTEFEVYSNKKEYKNASYCLQTSKIPTDLQTKSGLGLGKKWSLLKSQYGKSKSCSAEKCSYEYQTSIKMTAQQAKHFNVPLDSESAFFDRMGNIEIFLKNDIITGFTLYRADSY